MHRNITPPLRLQNLLMFQFFTLAKIQADNARVINMRNESNNTTIDAEAEEFTNSNIRTRANHASSKRKADESNTSNEEEEETKKDIE